MSFLGASTKTYRSYGKRKNNTTNKGAYALWDSSPETANRTNILPNSTAPSAPRRSLNSPSSSSSISISSDEDSPPPKPARTQALAATKPALVARKKAAGAANDKENNSSPFEGSPRRPVFSKAKSRMVLHSPVKARRVKKVQESSAEDESDAPKPSAPTQRVPLKPRFLGVEILVPAKKPSPLRAEVQQPEPKVEEDSEDESKPPVVRPSRRRKKMARGQESSEEAESPLEVVVEAPVKSARSSIRSSQSRASVDSQTVEEPVRLSLRSRARKAAAEDVEEEDELEESSGLTLEDPEEEEEDQLASDDDDELESDAEKDRLSSIAPSSHDFPSLLDPLLTATNQSHPLDFTSFITSPPSPFSPPTSISRAASRWTKIGEASYSEVFEREGIVVKIIPVAGKEVRPEEDEVGEEQDVPYSSDWASVEREIEISQLVGGEESAVEGFVGFKGAFIVQGSYPTTLITQWDAYKSSQTPYSDDQIRPDVLPADQVYAVVCLSHAGSDLEGYKLRSWTEAASVLWQVATICAEAEERLEFEHRDLHWGNVLVKPLAASSLPSALASLSLSTPPRKSKSSTSTSTTLTTTSLAPLSSGVQVTLIDFTLSRARVPGGEEDEGDRIVFDGFEDDCVFEGEGDHQFDVYRAMRRHVEENSEMEGGWEGFHPLTNVMWLHYLSLKLLHSKKLKPPPAAPSPTAFPSCPSVSSSPFKSRPSTRRASALPPSRSTALTLETGKRKARTLPAKLADEARAKREREAWKMLKVVEGG
ncbi:hypothetical protein BCR35DRAFT_160117 [Leucosporidium creatinivorum]|uniref:non-specific serine/threonine protein kinase n=1 Tax=Leucosporidium creatinivorum TaxID=106004 RepID=A0A1Y2EMF1_9BASI|nr:hypothetical protein BCR35DRAFT_160117 [Leucosporidium creatinivorum]